MNSTKNTGLEKKKFHGVKLSEQDELEKLYEVNIQGYSLARLRHMMKKIMKKTPR